jgi:hypothetical protein
MRGKRPPVKSAVCLDGEKSGTIVGRERRGAEEKVPLDAPNCDRNYGSFNAKFTAVFIFHHEHARGIYKPKCVERGNSAPFGSVRQ